MMMTTDDGATWEIDPAMSTGCAGHFYWSDSGVECPWQGGPNGECPPGCELWQLEAYADLENYVEETVMCRGPGSFGQMGLPCPDYANR